MRLWLIFLLFSLVIGCHQYDRTPSSQLDCIGLAAKILRTKVFGSEINHPDFYLWDNWGIEDGGVWHVYSLAADRKLAAGERHHHAHWRHFISNDKGKSWIDKGAVLKARSGNFSDNQAIWTGSVAKLQDGRVVAAYTGLSSENTFLQSISLAISDDFHHFARVSEGKPLISHVTHRKKLLDLGYYVDEIKHLGSFDGEVNGSIQSLRDPFIYQDESGLIHLFWSAKAFKSDSEVVSAVGHATIGDVNNLDSIKFLKPILPPDGDKFTQLELPNIVKLSDDRFAWIFSTTNRTSEKQPMSEIDAQVRVYFSNSIEGQLTAHNRGKSSVFKADETEVYGANLVRGTQENYLRVFNFDTAKEATPLTLPKSISLNDLLKADLE